MNRTLTSLLALGVPGLLVSACNESAYYPLQPSVPLVTGVRQADVSVSLDQYKFGVARAAVSPLPHVVLAGTASGRFWGAQQFRDGVRNQRRQQQWEVGIGSYATPWPRTALGVLAGYGQARSAFQQRYASASFSMGGGVSSGYQMSETATNRWFGQVYLITDTQPADARWQVQVHAAYRLSLVRYQQFRYQRNLYTPAVRTDEYDVPPAHWHSLSLGATIRPRAYPALGLQPSLGVALPLRANPRTGPNQDAYQTEVSHYGRWGQASIGVVLFPHALRRAGQ